MDLFTQEIYPKLLFLFNNFIPNRLFSPCGWVKPRKLMHEIGYCWVRYGRVCEEKTFLLCCNDQHRLYAALQTLWSSNPQIQPLTSECIIWKDKLFPRRYYSRLYVIIGIKLNNISELVYAEDIDEDVITCGYLYLYLIPILKDRAVFRNVFIRSQDGCLEDSYLFAVLLGQRFYMCLYPDKAVDPVFFCIAFVFQDILFYDNTLCGCDDKVTDKVAVVDYGRAVQVYADCLLKGCTSCIVHGYGPCPGRSRLIAEDYLAFCGYNIYIFDRRPHPHSFDFSQVCPERSRRDRHFPSP